MKNRHILLILVIIVLLALAYVVIAIDPVITGNAVRCSKDFECPENNICDMGRCKGSSNFACTLVSECASTYSCIEGMCTMGLGSSCVTENCPGGFQCLGVGNYKYCYFDKPVTKSFGPCLLGACERGLQCVRPAFPGDRIGICFTDIQVSEPQPKVEFDVRRVGIE